MVERNADLYQRKLLPAGDYDEMTSRSRQAQLQVALQQAILAERSIKSPFDGVVAERYAGPGDRINDNKIVSSRRSIRWWSRWSCPAAFTARSRPMPAPRSRSTRPSATSRFRPAVWRIDRVMDAASGTFTVLLKVENKGNAIPAGIRCSIRF